MGRASLLGFIFFVSLVILGFGTLLLQGWTPPWKELVTLQAHFESVQGLRNGNDARVDGVKYGTVTEILLHENQGVLVTVKLDAPVTLYQDFEIKVEAASVLGGSTVSIRRGSVEPALKKPYDVLPGRTAPGFEQIGELAAENRENLHALIANFRDLTDTMTKGQGTIGQLIQSDKLHREAVQTLKDVQDAVAGAKAEIKRIGDNLELVTNDIRKGKGPIGALLNDETMTLKLNTTLDNIEKTSENIKTITDKINEGDNTLARLVNDEEMGVQLKKIVENVEATSESIRNIAENLENGEGFVGRLLQDDELYVKVNQRLDDLDEIIGRAARATVEIVADSKFYSESHLSVTRAGIRITPSEDKYFQASVAFLGLDRDGDILFEKKIQQNESDTEVTADVQLAYHIPWLVDRRMTIRGGLIEGKLGAAIDLRWEDFIFVKHPVQISFEGRESYDDLQDDDIDEKISGPMLRLYFETPLWTRRDTWYEMLLSSVRLFGGWSRIGEDPEYLVGAGIQFPDEDIRAFIGLAGLAR